ncbi:ribonuclease H-like protein [Rostrohypoxylon terebratum]|nr:ribonuclease H-like protein [Rostrohypoxylon terebratum]
MTQGNSSGKWRCDCAVVFATPQSFGEHVQKTGHMKARWCTLCKRLFASKESLSQHKKTAAKHKKSPAVPAKGNANIPLPDKKPQAEKPNANAVPKKPAQVPKTAKPSTMAAGSSKGNKNTTRNPTKNPTAVDYTANQLPKAVQVPFSTYQLVPMPMPMPMTEPLNPHSIKYPWVSGRQDANLINTATTKCHSEVRLLDQGYYTGNPLFRGDHKFSIKQFVSTPARVQGSMKRKAIALDCEMVGVAGGKDELAHLCAVDLFTGEVLINSLVDPTQPVKDYRTRWSGITLTKMVTAKASGKTLDGWPAAREKLFEFADEDTILVGHALQHDLRVLYIAHRRVLDSAVLVAEAVFGRAQRLLRCWGLKNASQDILGIKIQTSKMGHDCLEDTLATRELVLWCLQNPEKLSQWGKDALAKYQEERRRIEERRRAKEKARKEKEERERRIEREKEESSVAWSPAVAYSHGGRDNDYDDYYHDYDLDYAQLHGSAYFGGLHPHDYYHGLLSRQSVTGAWA